MTKVKIGAVVWMRNECFPKADDEPSLQHATKKEKARWNGQQRLARDLGVRERIFKTALQLYLFAPKTYDIAVIAAASKLHRVALISRFLCISLVALPSGEMLCHASSG